MEIKIKKYDPSVDAAPYFITYEVPFTDKMTLLEAVMYIHENCEFVAFDYNCHGRQCGRCSVMLDGMPVLLCATPLEDSDHIIEPLAGQVVIRDLIVDKSDYHDRLSREYIRIRTEAIREEEVDVFDGTVADDIRSLNLCMRCGMCDAACPAKGLYPDEFAGPATMIALAFRDLDSYDQGDRIIEAVSKGLYRCIQCGTCDQVCQRYEINHLEVWQKLREKAEARNLKPSYAE